MVENYGRREFLGRVAAATPFLWIPRDDARAASRRAASEMHAGLVIIGGGLGGCAAALAAARNGLSVIMTEETAWIGGQLTQQAVPPDENRWIETVGGTRSYLGLRTGIRDYYRQHRPLTESARGTPRLNPGNGWVSRLCCEPRIALAVLYEMLAPFIASGQLTILLRHRALDADLHGDRVRAVRVRSAEHGGDVVLHAPFFADATELGDLLPLTETEYVTGAESRGQTGEPHAKDDVQPDNVQGFTMCFAVEYLAGEEHTIPKPATYDEWRRVSMTAADGATHRLMSFDDADSRRIGFDPVARTGFWTYRRVLDRDVFVPGTYAGDVTLVNWAQNDYSFGSLIDVDAATAARHVERAKQLSLSLLHWLQVEAPRPDGGAGWTGLRLRPDIVGTADGLAMYPYIRESRRIQAEFTVLEQHVTEAARMQETGLARGEVSAMPFPDAVGIGHYSMDLHVTTRGDRGRYGATLPFQIPLGALIPRRVENLLPACKNLGVTHLTNGCYRLHPIEWNIGESVGTLVAFCLANKVPPRGVRAAASRLRALQSQLSSSGVPLEWPRDLPR